MTFFVFHDFRGQCLVHGLSNLPLPDAFFTELRLKTAYSNKSVVCELDVLVVRFLSFPAPVCMGKLNFRAHNCFQPNLYSSTSIAKNSVMYPDICSSWFWPMIISMYQFNSVPFLVLERYTKVFPVTKKTTRNANIFHEGVNFS